MTADLPTFTLAVPLERFLAAPEPERALLLAHGARFQGSQVVTENVPVALVDQIPELFGRGAASIQLTDCTATLLREVAMPEVTRDLLAMTYALAIRSWEPTDWPRVNRAIIERWSESGLRYIKRKSWKGVEA